MHNWSASAKAARVPEPASSVNSCQETVDLPTPAEPVIHKTGTRPLAIRAPPGRPVEPPAASITIAMPAILGSGSTRVNRITRADRLETQEPQQRRTRALPPALAALD
jgi:hypothetical protein